tara:strand:- start:4094 stop:5023 length:930 start_codon:yes stop_codon:yes gene_type:complete
MEISLDDLWGDLESSLNEMNVKEIKKSCCEHRNRAIISKDFGEVCLDCCQVLYCKVFETKEWNVYKDESGKMSSASQRADEYAKDNPYDNGGTVPGLNKNSFMMKMHWQQTFSHKQKTYWKISEKLQEYCETLKISNNILCDAKKMWHICMESGKLTRASVRNGLISACLYYACIQNNIHADRKKIIEHTDGNNKGFLKGEKVFLDIMKSTETYKNIGVEIHDVSENNSFIKHCSMLELPYKTSFLCEEVYKKNKDKLDSVTSKSITAGIIFYVVKNNLGIKTPSKSKISQELNVCVPTINKVVSLLEN